MSLQAQIEKALGQQVEMVSWLTVVANGKAFTYQTTSTGKLKKNSLRRDWEYESLCLTRTAREEL